MNRWSIASVPHRPKVSSSLASSGRAKSGLPNDFIVAYLNDPSRAANPDPYGKDQHSAHHYLKRSRKQWSVHVTVPNPGYRRQFQRYDNHGGDKGHMKVFDQERKRMANTAGGRRQSRHRAAQHRTPTTGHRSVIG